MSSFLDRLKQKKVIPTTPEDEKKDKLKAQQAASPDASSASAAEQLKVDILQMTHAIVIYAQMAGASINDYTITIDGEGDTVTIKGQRKRPGLEHFEQKDIESVEQEHVLEECSWGTFYRQIILPAEVDAQKTEAKMLEGVLMLLLPLKSMADRGVRIQVKAL